MGLMFSNTEAMLAMAPTTSAMVLKPSGQTHSFYQCLRGGDNQTALRNSSGGFAKFSVWSFIEYAFQVHKNPILRSVASTRRQNYLPPALLLPYSGVFHLPLCCCVRFSLSHERCMPLRCAVAPRRGNNSNSKRLPRNMRYRNTQQKLHANINHIMSRRLWGCRRHLPARLRQWQGTVRRFVRRQRSPTHAPGSPCRAPPPR